jgi:TatD DNase family protein
VIDTHAHLDMIEDADEVVARAHEAGVATILTVGIGAASWPTALELAQRHDGVRAILGVHPHNAGGDDARRLDELERLLDDDRVVAVGEAGLDYFRDYAPHDAQRELFGAELELATAKRKPVVVHSRVADEDTAQALDGFDGTVVLHCFSSPRLLPVALERGYYVSFAGNITYKNAAELRLAASQVPPDRILAETDAPYLAPQAVRGRRNEPAFVMHTLAALAEARREDVDELERRIEENARTAFGLR